MFYHSPLLFLESLGTGEVLLIVFVIIVFFGGKKIPEMARVLGKGMREFKAAANNIQDEIQKSVTEIERHVNVESALREDPGAAVSVAKGSSEAPVTDPAVPPVLETPTPQLIRADEPTPEKKDPLKSE
ncbi:MAG TPA: twin-arginine translocase TatA/TatE family subunit [Bacteroidia bacterium]|jgi:sec-independent protein translocase protein TatA|nr:twin-arginine translocase TatA/TatE family subunit [Bacteroidia bacterium]